MNIEIIKCVLCQQLEDMLNKDFILICNNCGHIYPKYGRCYCDHNNESKIKVGVIEKISFEDKPHMIVRIGEERIWLEGSVEAFEGKDDDYIVGKWIEMLVKEVGTIVGECDFGDVNVLPLFVAEKVRVCKSLYLKNV